MNREETLKHPTMIFICGWPGSGKSALADAVKKILDVHHVDIDDVRKLMIGTPYPYPNESPELMRRDGQEMGGAYRFVFDCIDWHLAQGRSILTTATLSSKVHGQEKLRAVYEKYPIARVRIIQCISMKDTPGAVAELFSQRTFGEGGYVGGVNSPERYFEVKGRFNPIELPHLEIATWGGPGTPSRTSFSSHSTTS